MAAVAVLISKAVIGQLYDSIHHQILSLPDDVIVYPGHDYNGNTQSTVGEERKNNKRLGGGKSREDFIKIMSELKLAYPKYIDVALPANQACGRAWTSSLKVW